MPPKISEISQEAIGVRGQMPVEAIYGDSLEIRLKLKVIEVEDK